MGRVIITYNEIEDVINARKVDDCEESIDNGTCNGSCDNCKYWRTYKPLEDQTKQKQTKLFGD